MDDDSGRIKLVVSMVQGDLPSEYLTLAAPYTPDVRLGLFQGELKGTRQSRRQGAFRPDDIHVLLLAGNDYLLRNEPGWQLIDGRGKEAGDVKAPGGTPVQRRVDIDVAISEYLKRSDVPK